MTNKTLKYDHDITIEKTEPLIYIGRGLYCQGVRHDFS